MSDAGKPAGPSDVGDDGECGPRSSSSSSSAPPPPRPRLRRPPRLRLRPLSLGEDASSAMFFCVEMRGNTRVGPRVQVGPPAGAPLGLWPGARRAEHSDEIAIELRQVCPPQFFTWSPAHTATTAPSARGHASAPCTTGAARSRSHGSPARPRRSARPPHG